MNFKSMLRAFGLLALSQQAAAHEDLDLGIAAVELDRRCRAQITLKNYGRELPEAFYLSVRPAYVVLEKGGEQEEMNSLRALDKKRALQPTGGTLKIQSRKSFASNPKPMGVKIQLEGEFLDYGAANDALRESMDCVPGKGQIAGEKIPDTQPDIAVHTARIDPANCELTVRFHNLTSIGLAADAWDRDQGAFLMQLSLPSHERQPDIPLVVLDPQQRFTRQDSQLEYRVSLPKIAAEKWRGGLWQVAGERGFPHKQIEISLPEICRAAAAAE